MHAYLDHVRLAQLKRNAADVHTRAQRHVSSERRRLLEGLHLRLLHRLLLLLNLVLLLERLGKLARLGQVGLDVRGQVVVCQAELCACATRVSATPPPRGAVQGLPCFRCSNEDDDDDDDDDDIFRKEKREKKTDRE